MYGDSIAYDPTLQDDGGVPTYNEDAPGYAPYGNPNSLDNFEGDLAAYGQIGWR